MCALAFVPATDVPKVTYIRGKTARGRRKAVPVRYEPKLWNQYDAVLQGIARTNNASEGWHNRFQVLLGRYHPSLYAFLNELQQEQGETECMQRQLQLGQKIRALPTNYFSTIENWIFNIVSQYDQYVQQNEEIKYLNTLGYHLHF
ncbi:uncharacterized protein LOC122500730 [Leptopilina heterotoma]|uniref:uncharacterized protein LOC122500730 n=1 Tax=Leptopilina heterotoma TaxID=63436 RepID=UPI001CA7E384|nr:uncharacterized protein LOC122500730 [Leptopilina heterotoma]